MEDNNRDNQLQEFFAVTLGGTYSVKANDGHGGYQPIAECIFELVGKTSPVGRTFSGPMMSVGVRLIEFIPEGGGITSFQRKIEKCNTVWWGEQSGRIVALFLDKEASLKCARTSGLVQEDERWLEQTKEVLQAIGEDHPTFSICRWEDLALEVAKQEVAITALG